MSRMSNLQLVAVFVVVVIAVLAFTVGVSAVFMPPVQVDETESPAYDTDELNVDPIPATGEVTADTDAEEGIVVIDESHLNRFDRSEITAMTEALTAQGVEIKYHSADDDLSDSLHEADAFILIDPAIEVDSADIDTIQQFVDQDGRLILLGEPVRTAMQVDLFGAVVSPIETHMNPVANRFGIHFGSDYLYNMQHNDGNHRNVIVTGTNEGSMHLTHVSDVETGVVYTATYVESAEGTPVVVASDGTQRYQTDREETEFPVAVIDGNVLAVGDSSFLRGETFNVGDNNHFIAALVEFAAEGDRDPESLNGEPDPPDVDDEMTPDPDNESVESEPTP